MITIPAAMVSSIWPIQTYRCQVLEGRNGGCGQVYIYIERHVHNRFTAWSRLGLVRCSLAVWFPMSNREQTDVKPWETTDMDTEDRPQRRHT